MRPKILITLDTGILSRREIPFPGVELKQAYAQAVIKAGGIPLHVAPTESKEVIENMAEMMDGLVVSGGDFDIPPALYDAEPDANRRIDPPKNDRTNFEAELLREALTRNTPILGICGGMQLLGVILGATLLQDIDTEIENSLEHEQGNSPAEPSHAVQLTANSQMAHALSLTQIHVNSTHHQALADVPKTLLVEGRSPDGVIELIRHAQRPHVFGAQWHPELLGDRVSDLLYGDLVKAATHYQKQPKMPE